MAQAHPQGPLQAVLATGRRQPGGETHRGDANRSSTKEATDIERECALTVSSQGGVAQRLRSFVSPFAAAGRDATIVAVPIARLQTAVARKVNGRHGWKDAARVWRWQGWEEGLGGCRSSALESGGTISLPSSLFTR